MAGRQLKIAYSLPFPMGSPGIGAAARSQVLELARQGCSVEVFCWSSLQPLPGLKVFKSKMLFPVPQRLIGRENACRLHDLATSTLLKSRRSEFDIVHTWPMAAELTLGVARSRGWLGVREAPNTHTGHAMHVVEAEHKALGIPQEAGHTHAFNRTILERELREYEAADLILAPSALAIETFVDRGIPRERVALKSYGFDPQRYLSDTERKLPTELVFSFVGRCEPRKGVHYALEAWHRSGVADRTKFHITGRFVPGYREYLEPLLQHRNIELHDFVSDLRPTYQAADVLVLASIEEGSALVTYEAQASGCALLVSGAAGARITHGEEGLVHKAGDVQTLAEHMRKLADDPKLVHAMQKKGTINVQKYTWERATEDLMEAYGAALDRVAAE